MESIRKIIAVLCLLATSGAAATYAQHANNDEARSTSALTRNAEFILTAIDERAVAQFKNAWRSVGAGYDKIEAAILLYRK